MSDRVVNLFEIRTPFSQTPIRRTQWSNVFFTESTLKGPVHGTGISFQYFNKSRDCLKVYHQNSELLSTVLFVYLS